MLCHDRTVAGCIISPDVFIDPLLAEHLSRMEREKGEDIILSAGQPDRVRAAHYVSLLIIDCQVSLRPDRPGMPSPLFPSQVRHHSGAQLFYAEGLYDIVVAAHDKPGDPVLFLHPRGQEEDRAGQLFPDLPAHAQPVQIRHVNVQDDHIRTAPDPVKRLHPASGCDHLVSLEFKIILQKKYDPFLIVRDQNPLSHIVSLLFLPFLKEYFTRQIPIFFL